MENQNLIESLNNQLTKLENIMRESGYDSDLDVGVVFLEVDDKKSIGKQKFFRWVDDTFKIIETNISLAEGKKLQECLKNMRMAIKMRNCYSYLKVLISDIENNAEKYISISTKCQSDDFILTPLNNMHKEVLKVAKDRIQHKEGYRGIISDVCIALEDYIKKKINNPNIQDIGGAKLMEHVFSKDKPIIRLSDKAEEQKGFMFLFSGAIKAIRNKCTHKLYKLDLQEVLEILGFLSFLFRTADKGKVKNKF